MNSNHDGGSPGIPLKQEWYFTQVFSDIKQMVAQNKVDASLKLTVECLRNANDYENEAWAQKFHKLYQLLKKIKYQEKIEKYLLRTKRAEMVLDYGNAKHSLEKAEAYFNLLIPLLEDNSQKIEIRGALKKKEQKLDTKFKELKELEHSVRTRLAGKEREFKMVKLERKGNLALYCIKRANGYLKQLHAEKYKDYLDQKDLKQILRAIGKYNDLIRRKL